MQAIVNDYSDVKNLILITQKIIAIHYPSCEIVNASERLSKVMKSLQKRKVEKLLSKNFTRYVKYIFAQSPIRKYNLVRVNGEAIGK
jgi:hypothetical protein